MKNRRKDKDKLYLDAKYKIGSIAWKLKSGTRSDYYQDPRDSRFSNVKVVGYNIVYRDGKANITGYKLADGDTVSGEHNWDFKSLKEIKSFYKKLMIKDYHRSDHYKPRVDKLDDLTLEERKYLRLD